MASAFSRVVLAARSAAGSLATAQLRSCGARFTAGSTVPDARTFATRGAMLSPWHRKRWMPVVGWSAQQSNHGRSAGAMGSSSGGFNIDHSPLLRRTAAGSSPQEEVGAAANEGEGEGEGEEGTTSEVSNDTKPGANQRATQRRVRASHTRRLGKFQFSRAPLPVPDPPMFAVIHLGGKQYKVSEGDSVITNRMTAEVGVPIKVRKVLLAGSTKMTIIGTPLVESGVTVTAMVTEHFRGSKVQVFKKKRRKNYAKRQGHRSELTKLQIISVSRD